MRKGDEADPVDDEQIDTWWLHTTKSAPVARLINVIYKLREELKREKAKADKAYERMDAAYNENMAVFHRLHEAETALQNIAQYHPDWKGLTVNDHPNRAQIIDMAYEAVKNKTHAEEPKGYLDPKMGYYPHGKPSS